MGFSIKALILLSLIINGIAHAECDDLKTTHLANLSLCELKNRYAAAADRLREQGVLNPNRVGNVLAPRFINMPDWRAYLNKNGDSVYAAWRVYNPSPRTWEKWSNVARYIDNPGLHPRISTMKAPELLDWIKRLHASAMNGLLDSAQTGSFRQNVEEIIPLHFIDNAYKEDQIRTLSALPYASPRTGQKLMIYQPRICNDRMSPAAQALGPIPFKMFPKAPTEARRLCGDLKMAAASEVEDLMLDWAEYLLNGLKLYDAKSKEAPDVIEFASRVQQWMVVIHPFIDGNGRFSRFMMDLVLNELGLPLPTLDDMNLDFFSSPQRWAELVGIGMMNTVTALEACAVNTAGLGCKEVSEVAPRF